MLLRLYLFQVQWHFYCLVSYLKCTGEYFICVHGYSCLNLYNVTWSLKNQPLQRYLYLTVWLPITEYGIRVLNVKYCYFLQECKFVREVYYFSSVSFRESKKLFCLISVYLQLLERNYIRAVKSIDASKVLHEQAKIRMLPCFVC